jgi:hypothetical protein
MRVVLPEGVAPLSRLSGSSFRCRYNGETYAVTIVGGTGTACEGACWRF